MYVYKLISELTQYRSVLNFKNIYLRVFANLTEFNCLFKKNLENKNLLEGTFLLSNCRHINFCLHLKKKCGLYSKVVNVNESLNK